MCFLTRVPWVLKSNHLNLKCSQKTTSKLAIIATSKSLRILPSTIRLLAKLMTHSHSRRTCPASWTVTRMLAHLQPLPVWCDLPWHQQFQASQIPSLSQRRLPTNNFIKTYSKRLWWSRPTTQPNKSVTRAPQMSRLPCTITVHPIPSHLALPSPIEWSRAGVAAINV